jgi:hypothetical protein
MSHDAPKRVVLTEDPDHQPEEPWMEFRLTYQGPLRSSQRDPVGSQADPRANHKHDIRRTFHHQLKRLWEITPFLKTGRGSGPDVIVAVNSQRMAEPPLAYDIPSLAAKHAKFGFNFVPLVTHELDLICGLDILFLRPDRPGNLWRGDIDNRIKTLLDALTIPLANDNYHQRTPEIDERPLFCLLEEDKLITKLSIETDQLLEFVSPGMDVGDVRLMITVRLRPYELHLENLQFG